MAFDLSTAQSIQPATSGFDLSTAQPVRQNVSAERPKSLGGFASNVVKSGGEMLGGIYNAITSPIETVKNIGDIAAGGVYNVLPKDVVSFLDKFDSDPTNKDRAIKAANVIGGVYKDRYGSLEALGNTLYTDPVGAAGDLATILTAGGGAVTKAGKVAQLSPAIKTGEALQRTGAAINPLNALPLQTTGKVLSAGGNFLANVVNPKAAALVAATEGQGPQIVNALRNANAATPGYNLTAGEAVADLNLTKYPALQQEVARYASTPYYQRQLEQGQALINPLNVAESIPTAIAKRTDVTAPLYEAAVGTGKIADVTNVAKHVDDILKNNPGNTALVTEFNAIKKGLIDESGALRTDAKQISSTLDNIKAALAKEDNKFIKGELTKTKDMLANAIPGYTQAQEKFANLSKPINQMEVADYLKSKLQSTLRDENKLTPASYANALTNAPSTIKNATGLPAYQNISEIVTPAQMKILEGIKSDLANKAKFEEQAGFGGKLEKAIPADTLPKAPALFSKTVSLANSIINKLQGRIDRKIAIELATEMLKPENAAMSLEQALLRQQYITNIGLNVNPIAEFSKNALRSPAALGAIQLNQQNQNALAR
jgi:hypothetical protein